MQASQYTESNDEISLSELFLTLWAYKLFIAGICALGIVSGGFYAQNADKEYTSVAIFKLDESSADGASLNSELGSLARVSGFGIKTVEDVKNFSQSNADGVVIGSAIVEKIQEVSKKDTDKKNILFEIGPNDEIILNGNPRPIIQTQIRYRNPRIHLFNINYLVF